MHISNVFTAYKSGPYDIILAIFYPAVVYYKRTCIAPTNQTRIHGAMDHHQPVDCD